MAFKCVRLVLFVNRYIVWLMRSHAEVLGSIPDEDVFLFAFCIILYNNERMKNYKKKMKL